MYHVYVLKSSEGMVYTGHTCDLFRRLCKHNSGQCKTTKACGSWRLIYQEEYTTRGEAMKREKWLKSGAGREFVKSKVHGVESASAE